MKHLFLLAAVITIVAISCTPKTTTQISKPEMDKPEMKSTDIYTSISNLTPPTADKIDHPMTIHGDTRVDPYFWMRLSDDQKNTDTPDAQTQNVLDYINQENDYTTKALAHTETLQGQLFDEIVGRIKQTDQSVPYKYQGYYYISRFEEGKEYPIHSRKKGSLDAPEEIMLDVNKLAEGKDYYAVSGRNINSDNTILAYGEDVVSRRIYTIRFKNLTTGEYYDDVIENTTGSVVWAEGSNVVFYTRKDDALRSFKIFKHVLGTDPSIDQEVWHETDETFNTYVYKTKSKEYIIIGSGATLSDEYRYIKSDAPDSDWTVFQPREHKLEYSISHYKDKWYIRTNKDGAENFKLMTSGLAKTHKENWEEFIPHRKTALLQFTSIFNDYLVLSERIDGISKIRIMPWNGEGDHYVAFDEDAYVAYPSSNPEFETDDLRLTYSSLTTPSTTYDYNMVTKAFTQLKQQEVIGTFDQDDYRSERIMATARDGVQVPISIVYHKDTPIDGTAPILQYAYGSYGSSIDPYFSSVRLSLLDRGVVFAIAHIRGGQELGRQWYENGKFLKKKNTFFDFIDCGKHLTANGYGASDNLFAMGGSAGGLLMGAIMNYEPDMWKGVVAAVPFVDVVSTMLDESIPLTTGEFDEWGNPKDKEYYDYMKSYSPYDNVENKDYPATLITTGYHDSQVQYWEPVKWIAKLRDMKTDNNPLLLTCEMEAGHGGQSGRFRRYKETALEYAFILDMAGIHQ